MGKAGEVKAQSVLQDWVCQLTFMQQSVLLTAVRGPDGIHKDHVSKLLLRWLRRCVLYSAFESNRLQKAATFPNPYERGGGSFTGPSIGAPNDPQDAWTQQELAKYWMTVMDEKVTDYLRATDEMPHHFQLHFLHATEILGYHHPDLVIRGWWSDVYRRLTNDMHLYPETMGEMDARLGDNEQAWRDREEVTAREPEGE